MLAGWMYSDCTEPYKYSFGRQCCAQQWLQHHPAQFLHSVAQTAEYNLRNLPKMAGGSSIYLFICMVVVAVSSRRMADVGKFLLDTTPVNQPASQSAIPVGLVSGELFRTELRTAWYGTAVLWSSLLIIIILIRTYSRCLLIILLCKYNGMGSSNNLIQVCLKQYLTQNKGTRLNIVNAYFIQNNNRDIIIEKSRQVPTETIPLHLLYLIW